MNFHDSERMAGLLEAAGFEPASGPADADVIVLNTCTVREKAEDKVLSRIGELRSDARPGSQAPVIAVAGCLAQQDGAAMFRRARAVDVVVGTQGRAEASAARRRRPCGPAPVRSTSTPTTTCRSPWGWRGGRTRSRPMSPSSRAATTTVRSASCRTRAATSECARSPKSWGRSRRRFRAVGPKSTCWDRLSTTTRLPTIRTATSRPCWRPSTG